jgi:hypothetical protein
VKLGVRRAGPDRLSLWGKRARLSASLQRRGCASMTKKQPDRAAAARRRYALQPQPVHRRNLRTRTCARPGWRRAATRLSNTDLARPGQQLLSYFATSRSLSPPIVGERPGPLVAPPRTSVAAHPVPSGFGSKAGSRLGENASFSKAHLRTVRSFGIASSRQMARKVSPSAKRRQISEARSGVWKEGRPRPWLLVTYPNATQVLDCTTS